MFQQSDSIFDNRRFVVCMIACDPSWTTLILQFIKIYARTTAWHCARIAVSWQCMVNTSTSWCEIFFRQDLWRELGETDTFEEQRLKVREDILDGSIMSQIDQVIISVHLATVWVKAQEEMPLWGRRDACVEKKRCLCGEGICSS